MRKIVTNRGFQLIEHDKYSVDPEKVRLIQESSAIGDYADSWDKPGSSYLWISDSLHLNRDEVKYLIERMQSWLDGKRLFAEEETDINHR